MKKILTKLILPTLAIGIYSNVSCANIVITQQNDLDFRIEEVLRGDSDSETASSFICAPEAIEYLQKISISGKIKAILVWAKFLHEIEKFRRDSAEKAIDYGLYAEHPKFDEVFVTFKKSLNSYNKISLLLADTLLKLNLTENKNDLQNSMIECLTSLQEGLKNSMELYFLTVATAAVSSRKEASSLDFCTHSEITKIIPRFFKDIDIKKIIKENPNFVKNIDLMKPFFGE